MATWCRAVGCPELALPPDFRAVRLRVSGERMSRRCGDRTPSTAMAGLSLPNGHVRLIRDHEKLLRRGSYPERS